MKIKYLKHLEWKAEKHLFKEKKRWVLERKKTRSETQLEDLRSMSDHPDN